MVILYTVYCTYMMVILYIHEIYCTYMIVILYIYDGERAECRECARARSCLHVSFSSNHTFRIRYYNIKLLGAGVGFLVSNFGVRVQRSLRTAPIWGWEARNLRTVQFSI